MATMVQVTIKGFTDKPAYFNADAATSFMDTASGATMITFEQGHHITVIESAETIAARIRQGGS